MPLTHLPYLDRLLGDEAVSRHLGLEADLAAMLRFEVALARAEASAGMLDAETAGEIARKAEGFVPDADRMEVATLKDGVPAPNYVQQLRERVGGDAAAKVHFGATTQDVVDTALALKLEPVFALFEERLAAIDNAFADLLARFGDTPLMARSRMQAAIEITSGARITVWRKSVSRAALELAEQRRQMMILSLAGAAGTAEKFGDRIDAVRETMAAELGLAVPDYVPHADRGRIAAFAGFLSRLTGALGKFGQDVALMVQNGIDQMAVSGGGGSSAMPHKHNPVRAEILVTLARYNATQLSAIHHALVHEQERSGTAWTLEWLVLPQMIEATGTALNHALSLLTSVERIGDPA